MKDIFSQNRECVSSVQYKSSSKVPLKGKNLNGYVVDEESDKWTIKSENDPCSTILIKASKYSPIDSKCLNDKCTVNFDDYVVKVCEPIRTLLYITGKCSFTMNGLKVNSEETIHYFNNSRVKLVCDSFFIEIYLFVEVTLSLILV